jgi:ring-1,2-phenylacetyl-CoA epoxidase subunit PaaB
MAAQRADTQWPRFEVFQQTREGAPFQNVGSVHAPDAEIAMQNARDVFVRRPQTVSLWVVPAAAILARTAQELADEQPWHEETTVGEPVHVYHIFQKTSQRRSMHYVTYSGEVLAATLEQALQAAVARYGDKTTYVWWVVPEDKIIRSEAEDAPSMFRPAQRKSYRMPTGYHTRTMMREVRAQQEEQEE